MWVFGNGGYAWSIAQDQLDDAKLCVRTWNREDAEEALRRGLVGRLVGPTDSDYPYRVVCEPKDVALWIAREVFEIDYCKFKPTVDNQTVAGQIRERTLLDVFFACWDNLRDTPYRKVKRGKKGKVRVDSWLTRRRRASDDEDGWPPDPYSEPGFHVVGVV